MCSFLYDIAKRASTIISMVPTRKHARHVYLGDNSVMSTLKELKEEQRSMTLCLDQSTMEQSVSQTVAQELRKTGTDFLDAPVSGGKDTPYSTAWAKGLQVEP
ncbi:hypothetical protein B0J13DRAFT_648087 [Dactylonectria estremocensis]|uniref:3-hydroxyisobutyrate dehydrogenase n=1 Tax=Dactylonectria estremocensis TaxID=1079267 RepID=A0A9P9DNZ0_9HYPO|nr:hypothetical protein B0J13DRAFT_648087 [Dactylonectria estremocensis]